MKSKQPHPVDIYVGSQIRARRNILGLSQKKLANDLKITFQQLQKYENGTNRISASRLYVLSKLLGCSVEFFFEEYSDNPENANETVPSLKKYFQDKQTLNLIRNYYKIKDKNTRKAFIEVLKSMAKR